MHPYNLGQAAALTKLGVSARAAARAAEAAEARLPDLLAGIRRSAIGGGITGGLTGGISGAVAAPEGEGGSGFLRGVGAGALTGGALGAAAGGIGTRAAQNAHPERAHHRIKYIAGPAAVVPPGSKIVHRTPSNHRRAGRVTSPEAQAAERAIGRAQNATLLGGVGGGTAAGILAAPKEDNSPMAKLKKALGR